MIKNDELQTLRQTAERTGDSEDVWKYVDALEKRIETPHSALLYDEGDGEMTEQTAAAHVDARTVLKGAAELDPAFRTGPIQIVHSATMTYALEVRGQASATAHGQQGFRSSRGQLLLALQKAGIPVYVAFKDGGTWETAWLEELGPSSAIRKDPNPDLARFGWYAGEKVERGRPLFSRESYFQIPFVHDPKPLPQEGLV